MRVILCLTLFLILSACTVPVKKIYSQPQEEIDLIEEVFEEELVPIQKSLELVEVKNENWSFQVPVGWSLEEEKIATELPREAQRQMLIKSTDKEIVLGGLLPDDYYLDQVAQELNVEKYAESFIAINVLVYEGAVDFYDISWDEFFADFYPEVKEFNSRELFGQSDLKAVVVTATEGVWLGGQRVFVHVEDRFYDLSLHYKNSEVNEAEEVFRDFISNFQF
mgnify:CR=1 FL=1